MQFHHPEHSGRSVRLAYCLNLHPADTLEGLLEGLRTITLPLRERLAPGREFGVGMYAPADLARRLASAEGRGELDRLGSFLVEHALDAFTWNAFPFGGFGARGLKARVFEPRWCDPARLEFTAAVAYLARRLAGPPREGGHLSISTHTGWHTSSPCDVPLAARRLAEAGHGLRADGGDGGWRVLLGLEAEPRSNCNGTADVAAWLASVDATGLQPGGCRDLGVCLDTCHAAVEFEDPAQAMLDATAGGAPLAKLQFTSALALHATRREQLEPLLRLDEPRFLHQVTARTRDGLLRVGDLPELRAALDGPAGREWWRDTELRCHFHVPVDLAEVGGSGLTTTRAHADALLAAALARPERWGTDELHLEIETYTWDVLPREARGPGELVDGLEREYAHVIGRLADAGWQRA